MIRIFDVLISVIVLMIITPFLLLISMLIVLEDGFPIIFRQSRTGLNGKPFIMFKLRSMRNRQSEGLNLTVGGRDSRILKVGRLIRKSKLDEIPQLINVLRGDMSIVGPRPEVKKYTDLYDNKQRQVLSVRPGITDFASIEFRNENELLERAEHPEQFYIETIMPEKIQLNQIFVDNPSLRNYFAIIIRTIKKIILS